MQWFVMRPQLQSRSDLDLVVSGELATGTYKLKKQNEASPISNVLRHACPC